MAKILSTWFVNDPLNPNKVPEVHPELTKVDLNLSNDLVKKI